MIHRMLMAAVLAGSMPVGTDAQSLAEVAHLEAARRARITTPARIYSNADLDRFRDPGVARTRAVAGGTTLDEPGALPADTVAAADSAPGPAALNFDDRDAHYWQERRAALDDRISRARADVSALRLRLVAGGITPGERALIAAILREAEADLNALQDEWVAVDNDARLAPTTGARVSR